MRSSMTERALFCPWTAATSWSEMALIWVETLEMHGHNRSVLVNCPETITITDSEQSHTTSMTPLAYGWAKVVDKMGFTQEVDHFFDCLKNDQEPLTSGADAYKTQELMHRILTAAGLPGLE